MSIRLLSVVCLTAVLSACSSSSHLPDNPFPSREATDALLKRASQVPAASATDAEMLALEEWPLVGPFPAEIGSTPLTAVEGLNGDLTRAIATASSLQPTEQLDCVARQHAEFFREHQKSVGPRLRAFVDLRCGMADPKVGLWRLTYTTTASPEEVWASNKDDVLKWANEQLQKESGKEFGIRAISTSDKVMFVLVQTPRSVDIANRTMVQPDGKVRVTGRVRSEKIEAIAASVTKGDWGFSNCTHDESVSLPDFAVECEISPEDAQVRLVISEKERGRLLGKVYAEMMVSTRELPDRYQSPAIRRAIASLPAVVEDNPPVAPVAPEITEAAPEPLAPQQPSPRPSPLLETSSDEDKFVAEVTRVVNHVRQQANLPPLTLSAKQSAFNQRILPLFWSQSVEEQNQAVLAVLAGWDVQGFVVDGNLNTTHTPSWDPSTYVDSLLETPGGRQLLLDPNLGGLALGAAMDQDGRGRMVAVSSYAFMPDQEYQARVKAALHNLNEGRKKRGRPEFKESVKLRGIARDLAAKIARNEIDPDEAGEELAEQYSAKYKKGCQYMVMYRRSLEDFPVEQFDSARGRAAVMVAPYRPEGFPWGYYAVVVVVEN